MTATCFVYFCKEQVTGRKTMTSSCTRGSLDWILGKNSSPNGFSSIGTGCPGKVEPPFPEVFKRHVGVALRDMV